MHTTYIIQKDEFPQRLREIPKAPEKLYVKGQMPKPDAKMLCVVGSRKHSSYGAKACRELILGLKGHNICIVSGLALGIDAIAHRSALEAGLQTIAFPGSGLDDEVLHPSQNKPLADEILYSGGALISEFEMNQQGALWTFPQRNRLMAGISEVVIVVEAALPSGTLITSRLATEYNREVGAVPGDIFSPLSAGPHMLLGLGAVPITCSLDILRMFNLEPKDNEGVVQQSLLPNLTKNERSVLEYLKIEKHTSEQLTFKCALSAKDVSEALSSLEIQGLIGLNNRNEFFKF